MEISDALIDRLSRLAKLKFEGAARETIRQDMAKMMEFIDRIQTIESTGIEPLIHLTEAPAPPRSDAPDTDTARYKRPALANAPKADSDYFRVPKFLETE